MKKLFVLSVLTVFAATASFAQDIDPDKIIGVWVTADGGARVKIEKIGTKYFGKTVWLKEPLDENGNPKVDAKNPDPKLRNQPRIGLRILKDMVYDGKGIFKGGNVYDPKKGKTYCGKITMKDDNTLDLRGHLCGFGILGRTSKWTRYQE